MPVVGAADGVVVVTGTVGDFQVLKTTKTVGSLPK
jgi:hypothetical protein